VSALRPRLHAGTYVFVCVAPQVDASGLEVVASILEAEGRTLVLPEAQALERGFEALWRGCWITLDADTSLAMVGLTARFAGALADAGIACNVLAGAHHDHLFVPPERGEDAVAILSRLAI